MNYFFTLRKTNTESGYVVYSTKQTASHNHLNRNAEYQFGGNTLWMALKPVCAEAPAFLESTHSINTVHSSTLNVFHFHLLLITIVLLRIAKKNYFQAYELCSNFEQLNLKKKILISTSTRLKRLK